MLASDSLRLTASLNICRALRNLNAFAWPPTISNETVEPAPAEMSEALRDEVKANPKNEAQEYDSASLRILALHHYPLALPEGEGKKVYGVPDEPFMYMVSSATFLDAAMSIDVSVILHGHRHVTGLAR
jgi:hypothetical protein